MYNLCISTRKSVILGLESNSHLIQSMTFIRCFFFRKEKKYILSHTHLVNSLRASKTSSNETRLSEPYKELNVFFFFGVFVCVWGRGAGGGGVSKIYIEEKYK